jgi:hypothetical protein
MTIVFSICSALVILCIGMACKIEQLKCDIREFSSALDYSRGFYDHIKKELMQTEE